MTAQVTIILPVYNRVNLLKSTLKSVVDQTYENWIIKVCDDGSTENVKEVLNIFPDSRIHYYSLPHGGIGLTRNRGLSMADTPYCIMLDSDDLWDPKFLECTVRFLDRYEDIDMVQTAQGIINLDGVYVRRRTEVLTESQKEGNFQGMSFLNFDGLTYFLTEPLGQNNFSSLVMRTGVAQKARAAEIDFMEDWDYWVKLGREGIKISYLDAELCFYRDYPRQTDLERQITTLRNTVSMVKSHKFEVKWQRRIQRQIIGNMYELIGFDYLGLDKRLLAMTELLKSSAYSINIRRIYGLLKCLAPRFVQNVNKRITKKQMSL